MNEAQNLNIKKLNEIKEKIRKNEKLTDGEEMALLFWRDNKWLLKEE